MATGGGGVDGGAVAGAAEGAVVAGAVEGAVVAVGEACAAA